MRSKKLFGRGPCYVPPPASRTRTQQTEWYTYPPAGRPRREIYRAGNGRRQSLRGSSFLPCLLRLTTTRRATEPDSSVRCTFVSWVFTWTVVLHYTGFFPFLRRQRWVQSCRFSCLVWRNQIGLSWSGRVHAFLFWFSCTEPGEFANLSILLSNSNIVLKISHHFIRKI